MEKQITRPHLTQDPLPQATGDTTEVLVGDQLMRLLQEPGFQQEWDELFAACNWATVFQSRAYVATWYGIYLHTYLPVLVRLVSGGRLAGLLSLAQEKSGCLVGAGAEQAEYQVWLCGDQEEGAFIQKALSGLRQLFPKSEVKLKYIPAKVPLNWVEEHFNWKARCWIRKHRHPLLEVKEEALMKELQKKNRKEKMNRLKRMGELTFEKVIDENIFASIFDHLAHQFDFRKGAMFNKMTFHSDSCRKDFFLALFRQGLLHVTILRLDKEIIASNIGLKGKRWVHLQGMNTHAPHFARYSPGILHFLLLGKWLAAEGFEIFDLSPGADSYKESLATKYTQAYEFHYSSLLSCQVKKFNSMLKGNIKNLSFRVGMKQETLKKMKKDFTFQVEKMKKAIREGGTISGIQVRYQNKVINGETLTQIYPNTNGKERDEKIMLKKDSLKDLLQYDQEGGGQTRWQFLQEAMKRLEAEYHPYTFSDNKRLLACVWLRPSGNKRESSESLIKAREEAIILEGAYSHQTYNIRWEQFIKAVATEVSINQQKSKVYLARKKASY